MDLERIGASSDLTADVMTSAAGSSAALKRLIVRVAEVAQPEQGWTRLFKVVAKVAVAEWMEGELQVDLDGDDKGTTISFYAVLGVGIVERLFGPQYLAVPIDEFQRAVVLAPESVAPLTAHQAVNRLTLAMGRGVQNNDVANFELEESAKGDSERITAPPPPGFTLNEPDVHTKPTTPPPVKS